MLFAAGLAVLLSACNAAGTNQGIPTATSAGVEAGSNVAGASGVPDTPGAPDASNAPAAHGAVVASPNVDTTSILKQLTKQVVIGSTVDPTNGDQNPHGLAVVTKKPFGQSHLKIGDLVVCNYNDKNNVQGNGTTIEYLTPVAGSKPTTFASSPTLQGCSALLLSDFTYVFAEDSRVKSISEWTPLGKSAGVITDKSIVTPWSSAYAHLFDYPPGESVFVSDAYTGTINRWNSGGLGGTPSVTGSVVVGFPNNHGKPGHFLVASGLQYYKKTDTLYVVDGYNNTVYAFAHAYNVLNSSKGIVIGKDGKTFSGPNAKYAKVLYSGSPLNAPISAALLPNGNLIVGNTGDAKGTNLLVEIAANGTVLATKNVDKGAGGAIFGIAASGSTDSNTQVYFNDDNANNVQLLTR